MKLSIPSFIIALTTSCFAGSEARIYTDDAGVTHEFNGDKAQIVTFAHMAVALHHLGMEGDQIIGTYGEYANSGSDLDFDDFSVPSSFPADPEPEELQWLSKIDNLSPGCLAQWCQEFDLDLLKTLQPDFLMIHGYRQSPWAISAIVQNVTDMGIPIIYNEISMQDEIEENLCTEEAFEDCHGKSMIEVIEQMEEIAIFLGTEIPDSVQDDKKEMCKAAEEFTKNAKIAHDKGVRALAGYLSLGTSYIADPRTDMVLRMFEELGAPIMHYGKCTSETCTETYYWEYLPIEDYFPCEDRDTCAHETLYPVDFWLYDHRTTLIVTTDEFAQSFPDKAIVAKQYAYWPIGGRIISYKHATEILNIVGSELGKAEKLHPETSCSADIDVSSVAHKKIGLDGGEYACFDPQFHNQAYKDCPAETSEASIHGHAGFFYILTITLFSLFF